MSLIISRPEGLYCPAGDFFIDPSRPVDRAVITHAHSDHARPGCRHYLAAAEGAAVLRVRLGAIELQAVEYGETVEHRGVTISLHPAGHVLGSAQVRVAHGGQVWVASGDYKTEDDGISTPYAPVRCNTFITESTFGLPVYRWPPQAALYSEINQWWRDNARAARTSILYCYAFGKAQRILAGLETSIGPVVVHGAVARINDAYRRSGVTLPATFRVRKRSEAESTDSGLADSELADGESADTPIDPAALPSAIVLAPPSASNSRWIARFPEAAEAFASGWMLLRGARRRRGFERGFAVSDHADWLGLNAAIRASGAERVLVTHGNVAVMVRWLRDLGLDAAAFETPYGQEDDDDRPDDHEPR